jgi:hypothetical protein
LVVMMAPPQHSSVVKTAACHVMSVPPCLDTNASTCYCSGAVHMHYVGQTAAERPAWFSAALAAAIGP